MGIGYHKLKARDSSLSIALLKFNRLKAPSRPNMEILSGMICVVNQKNKIVDKLGWLFTDRNNYYVLYMNYYKTAYYIGHGAKFRIVSKESLGIMLYVSRGLIFFFRRCREYFLFS